MQIGTWFFSPTPQYYDHAILPLTNLWKTIEKIISQLEKRKTRLIITWQHHLLAKAEICSTMIEENIGEVSNGNREKFFTGNGYNFEDVIDYVGKTESETDIDYQPQVNYWFPTPFKPRIDFISRMNLAHQGGQVQANYCIVHNVYTTVPCKLIVKSLTCISKISKRKRILLALKNKHFKL